jgi:hypothetical protein
VPAKDFDEMQITDLSPMHHFTVETAPILSAAHVPQWADRDKDSPGFFTVLLDFHQDDSDLDPDSLALHRTGIIRVVGLLLEMQGV